MKHLERYVTFGYCLSYILPNAWMIVATQTCSISRLTSNPTRSFKCQYLSRSRVDISCLTVGAARHSLIELPPTNTLTIAGMAAAGRAAEVASENKPPGPSWLDSGIQTER